MSIQIRGKAVTGKSFLLWTEVMSIRSYESSKTPDLQEYLSFMYDM